MSQGIKCTGSEVKEGDLVRDKATTVVLRLRSALTIARPNYNEQGQLWTQVDGLREVRRGRSLSQGLRVALFMDEW